MRPLKGGARLRSALTLLGDFGLPRPQMNERSALTLLALGNLRRRTPWHQCEAPLLGVTPIMEWIGIEYGLVYAPNTRETVRRQTLHQFVQAGIAALNPDDPSRPINSPKTVYALTPEARAVISSYGSKDYRRELAAFRDRLPGLIERHAKSRARRLVPISLGAGKSIELSAGEHSDVTRAVVEVLRPQFFPAARVLYVGDTGNKWSFFDEVEARHLSLELDRHGKMPDIIFHDPARDWMVVVEVVTSHGPVDPKRRVELDQLLRDSGRGIVYITAFPSRAVLARYVAQISWETEAWCADSPTHMIHFDGERFLGPYE
jgi:type II restriction enzyme